MAEFGPQATAAPDLQSAITPKEGVETTPALALGLGSIFDNANGLVKNLKASGSEKKLADFTRQQLLVADALDQGKLRSSAHARTMMRNNLINAISSNPTLAGELVKAQASIIGLSGAAGVVDEGTIAEQRKMARWDQLQSAGVLSHDASEEEFEYVNDIQLQAEAATERYNERIRTIDAALKNEQLSKARRESLEAERELANKNYLEGIQGAEFDGMRGRFSNILKDGTLSEAEKVQAIEDTYTNFRNTISTQLGEATSQQSQHLMAPFEMMYEQYKKRATGEMDDAELTRNLERTVALQKKIALADRTIARQVAATELFGQSGVLEVLAGANMQLFNSSLDFLAGNNPTPYSEDRDKGQAFKMYGEALIRGMNSDSEAARNEATERMTQLMGSLDEFEGTLRRDAIKGKTPVEFLASPEFLSARNAHPEAFTDTAAVEDVLQRHYADEVWGMVQKQFRESNVITPPEFGLQPGPEGETEFTPTPDAVGYRTTPSGMEFFPIDSTDPDATRKARQLNKDLKPIINTTIRAFSHLEGNSNYGQAWESVAEEIMGGKPTAGGDVTDDLSMDSFREGRGRLSEALTTGGYVGDGDYQNAQTPAEVAASFIGFSEGEEQSTLSSFIARATGQNIDVRSTAWCAAFVNAALGAKGQRGTGKLNAKSFLDWGTAVANPQQGDIAVFDRGDPGSWQGHVGFYVGESEKPGYVRILGGNQNNKVSIRDYPISKLRGFRRA